MAIENHRHCQATILGAAGSPAGSGISWGQINTLEAVNIDKFYPNWKTEFLDNNNITGDLRDILNIINTSLGQVLSSKGGELSEGNIKVTSPVEYAIIGGNSSNNGRVFIASGYDPNNYNHYEYGAYLALAGCNYNLDVSPKQGQFQLTAKGTNGVYSLLGSPTGNLKWNNLNVVTANDALTQLSIMSGTSPSQKTLSFSDFLKYDGTTAYVLNHPLQLQASQEYAIIGKTDDDGRVFICSGEDYTTGAYACFVGGKYDADTSETNTKRGTFQLTASLLQDDDQRQVCSLIGTPDGKLTWNDKEVSTQNWVSQNFLSIESGGDEGAGSNITSISELKAWAEQEFLSIRDFGETVSPSEVSAMLTSMLNSNNVVYYVQQNGSNGDEDGSKDKPFKTISKAIEQANKQRFVGNAMLTIYLKGDYTLGNSALNIYHPDLIQNKQCQIASDPESDQSSIRVKCKDMPRYFEAIRAYCNIEFNNLNFIGDMESGDLSTYSARRTYVISNPGGMNSIKIDNCTFSNCNTCINGSNFTIENTSIEYCGEIGDIGTGPRVSIRNSLTVSNCIDGFNTNSGAIQWIVPNDKVMSIRDIARSFFNIGKGANIQLVFISDEITPTTRITLPDIQETDPWTMKTIAQFLVGEQRFVIDSVEGNGIVMFNNNAINKGCNLWFELPEQSDSVIAERFGRLFNHKFKYNNETFDPAATTCD